MSFSNKTINPPTNKPHIVLRDRFWRVSFCDTKSRHANVKLFNEAHKFAGKLNAAKQKHDDLVKTRKRMGRGALVRSKSTVVHKSNPVYYNPDSPP